MADGDELEDGDAPQTQQSPVQDSLSASDPLIDAGANEDVKYSGYEEESGFNMALFFARNAFCEFNHNLMLWNMAHLWNRGSRFPYNCYRHWDRVFLRDEPGKSAISIHSKEGIAQGCVQSINVYAVGTLPLEHDMRKAIPQALQLWFADDAGATV